MKSLNMKKLKLYNVPVTWTMYSTISVVAENDEDAKIQTGKDIAGCNLPQGGYEFNSMQARFDRMKLNDENRYYGGIYYLADVWAPYDYWVYLCDMFDFAEAFRHAKKILDMKLYDEEEVEFQKALAECLLDDKEIQKHRPAYLKKLAECMGLNNK